MAGAIGEILGLAVGVAVSPIPVVAVILLMFTPGARANAVAFLVGWVLGLVVVGVVVLAVGIGGPSADARDASGWVKLLLGIALLGLAWRRWTHRRRGAVEPHAPAWMAAVDRFTAVRSFLVGAALAAVNPKNLALTVAAAASIAGAGLSRGDEVVTLAVFVVIASASIALPVLGYVIAGERAAPTLTTWREWLLANNDTVMAVLLLVFGAKLLGDGIQILG